MNFIRRWRHGAEREQEQLLVRLWTVNTLNADDNPQVAKLASDARVELKSDELVSRWTCAESKQIWVVERRSLLAHIRVE